MAIIRTNALPLPFFRAQRAWSIVEGHVSDGACPERWQIRYIEGRITNADACDECRELNCWF